MSDRIDAIQMYLDELARHAAADKAGTPIPLSAGGKLVIEAMRIIDAVEKVGKEFREAVEAKPTPADRSGE